MLKLKIQSVDSQTAYEQYFIQNSELVSHY